MTASWTLEQLAGFLATWSAAARYRDARGRHPLEVVWEDLSAAWGPEGAPRDVRWDLHLRVGRTGEPTFPGIGRARRSSFSVLNSQFSTRNASAPPP